MFKVILVFLMDGKRIKSGAVKGAIAKEAVNLLARIVIKKLGG